MKIKVIANEEDVNEFLAPPLAFIFFYNRAAVLLLS